LEAAAAELEVVTPNRSIIVELALRRRQDPLPGSFRILIKTLSPKCRIMPQNLLDPANPDNW
jgi:hypothetical protein